MMDGVRFDVRYAWRGLLRAPLFACGVALTIGLGLGFAASAFTVVNAYVFKPFEIRDPYRVFEPSWDTETERRRGFNLDDFTALGRSNNVIEDSAAFANVQVAENTLTIYGQLVTANYFEMLGIRPLLGRMLEDADASRPGERAVAVLPYEGWVAHYGADPSIVGRDVRIGRGTYTVIGVAQSGFSGFGDSPLVFWAPITMAGLMPVRDPYGADRPSTLTALVRTRPGVSGKEAAAWFDAWIKQRYASSPSPLRPTLSRLDSRATRVPLNGRTLTLFTTIEAAFGIVLLIACANVANLMLARGISRQREIAVRLSLGASRSRVIRQLFIESAILSIPAAAIGYALTLASSRVIPAAIMSTWPDALPPVTALLAPMTPDGRVMAFLVFGAFGAAALFGLLPALHSSRTSLTRASRGEFGGGMRASRLRNALVIAQVAACALFLVTAVGVVNELRRLSTIDTGIAIDSLADVRVPELYRAQMADRLVSDPNIVGVAAAWRPPLYGPLSSIVVAHEGRGDNETIGMLVVSGNYFDLVGVPLLEGRSFTREEGERGAEVAVVSEATARHFWPGGTAIGQTLDLAEATRRLPIAQRLTQRRVRIIGVAKDVTSGSIVDGRDPSCVYLPTAITAKGAMALLVRTRGDINTLPASVASAASTIREDAAFPIFPMRQVVGLQLWVMGAFSSSAAALAVIALIFAVSGTYAVIAYVVSHRTREFGIRIALGATARDVVRSVVVDAGRLGMIGVVIGAVIAFGLSELLKATIEILPTFGAQSYVIGVAVVAVATLVAAAVPSRRAGQVDPSEALRAE